MGNGTANMAFVLSAFWSICPTLFLFIWQSYSLSILLSLSVGGFCLLSLSDNFICLYVSLSVVNIISLCLSICLSLSVCLISSYLIVYPWLSIFLTACPFIFHSLYLRQPLCISACLSFSLSVYLSP
jgi:hypothetical protein